MITDTCLVSVIVPVYNGASYIAQSVLSALDQRDVSLEVLVVDDGSTDRTVEIIQTLAGENPRVKLLRHPAHQNRGTSLTRQLGVRSSRGAFIALLDADDRFLPGKLAAQLAAFEAHPGMVLCHTGAKTVDANGRATWSEYDNIFNRHPRGPGEYELSSCEDMLRRNHVCNSSVMVRASALRYLKFGIPQLFQYEDWLMWTMLAQRGTFYFLPDRLVEYRVHDESFTASVSENPLRIVYAKVELLLSVLATIEDPRTIQKAEEELQATLQRALNVYGQVPSLYKPRTYRLARRVRRMLGKLRLV
jgi:glycosyltransferase involved in cell wall biosynthesis